VARSELASLFLNKEQSAISERSVQAIGKFYHVLLSGLIMQWLIDPEHALSARDLTEALVSIAEGIQRTRKTPKSKPAGRSKKRS
jgi:hypothetical protein